MKMDTTTWILLAAALLFLIYELQKKQQAAATGSLSGGYYPGAGGAAGAAGAAGQTSLLQQLLGGTGNTQKPSAGISAGGSAGQSTSTVTPTRVPAWLLPPRTPVATINAPDTALIPSVAPPVWTNPTMPYFPSDTVDTVPSDTSNIFITPEAPPTWENPVMNTNVTSTVFDPNTGLPIPSSLGDNTYDPTAFSPVDLQTIDTSTLGGIDYLPSVDTYGGEGSGGGLNTSDFSYDEPMDYSGGD
jgi:hypothetical protein